MEEEVNYSEVVFKSKSQPAPTEANHDLTVYSSVKREKKSVDVSPKANKDAGDSTDKRNISTTQSEAVKAASRSPHFRLLVVCSGTLCIVVVLSIIAIVYITKMMNDGKANFEAELGNLTAANQQLIMENSILLKDIHNLNWTMGVILRFNSFPVDAYCPNKTCRPCQSGWIQFQEKCYLFYENDSPWRTWDDSRTFCQSNGADLLVIDNPEEQSFISTNIKRYYDDFHGYWMGLKQRANNNWTWVDGRIATLQYWIKGVFGTSLPCALMIPVMNYTSNWAPAKCSMLNRFICESQVLIKSN
ncbi:natural killer cells antigen CD94-like [Betta splendens]|uniref:Natural killer cells antigen CD94-like n=1 Tax=Betta splendens TaxID=158456 RepID=A0A6P7KN24_BETSP|nr:natural killer cells antigen CD94-like [Betta splendens]